MRSASEETTERTPEGTTESGSEHSIAGASEHSPETLVRALRRREAETCREELDAALDAVEACGEFTPEQREILAAFAARLSHRVLAAPRTGLAEGRVDPEAAADLFDLP